MNESKHTAALPESESPERAVLVAVTPDAADNRRTAEYLDELEFLAETAGIRTVRRFTQRMPCLLCKSPSPRD